MFKLAKFDIIEQARAERPSTAWTLAFIANIQYVVFKTEFPLGQVNNFPLFLKKNPYVISFYINRVHRKPYQDNLCFFRCLHLHFHFKDKKMVQFYNILINGEHITIIQKFKVIPLEISKVSP